MALISFINKKTYEITDELEDYIYCDYELRYIIRELNRKGYKTSFSCAGHNQIGLLLDLHKSPIGEINEYLEACKTDASLHFISKDAEYFYHKYPHIALPHQYSPPLRWLKFVSKYIFDHRSWKNHSLFYLDASRTNALFS